MGSLANKALRKARNNVHAAFDPMWKNGGMKRTQAYEWLAKALGISLANCHVGMFDGHTCAAAIAVIRKRNGTL